MQRHETVVELDQAMIQEMLRAYVLAKFQHPVTPFHEVRLKVLPDKFVVRVIDPPGTQFTEVKR